MTETYKPKQLRISRRKLAEMTDGEVLAAALQHAALHYLAPDFEIRVLNNHLDFRTVLTEGVGFGLSYQSCCAAEEAGDDACWEVRDIIGSGSALFDFLQDALIECNSAEWRWDIDNVSSLGLVPAEVQAERFMWLWLNSLYAADMPCEEASGYMRTYDA